MDPHTRHQGRLCRVAERHHHVAGPLGCGCEDAGEHPAHRPDGAVEAELTEVHDLLGQAVGSTRAATSTATAMGRSKAVPDLGIDAGERLTVMRRCGSGTPLLEVPALMRSVDCRHAVSGRPLTAKWGSPWAMSASTSTSAPSRPVSATDLVRPRLISPPHGRAAVRRDRSRA